MALDQHDMEWLDEKFAALYKRIADDLILSTAREEMFQRDVERKFTLNETKINSLTSEVVSIKVEVDWHKWYIRTALSAVLISSAGLVYVASQVI
jgi:hypothetical protein